MRNFLKSVRVKLVKSAVPVAAIATAAAAQAYDGDTNAAALISGVQDSFNDVLPVAVAIIGTLLAIGIVLKVLRKAGASR